MRPIPEFLGMAVGGISYPEYTIWIRQDGFSIEKEGMTDKVYALLFKEHQKTWTCTCPSFVYKGWCKHPGIVINILQEVILEGRLK